MAHKEKDGMTAPRRAEDKESGASWIVASGRACSLLPIGRWAVGECLAGTPYLSCNNRLNYPLCGQERFCTWPKKYWLITDGMK